MLVVDEESIYIIDWDEPMFAPKERDLMFIGGGIGNVWNKPHEIDYFMKVMVKQASIKPFCLITDMSELLKI